MVVGFVTHHFIQNLFCLQKKWQNEQKNCAEYFCHLMQILELFLTKIVTVNKRCVLSVMAILKFCCITNSPKR